jgi:GxxExxY protein
MSHREDARTPGTDRELLNKTAKVIIDKAIVVHSKLGPGLLESIYRRCLTHELRNAGQKVVVEQLVPVHYDGL